MSEIVDNIWEKTRKIALELTIEDAKEIASAFKFFNEAVGTKRINDGDYFLHTFLANVARYQTKFTDAEKDFLLNDAKTGRGQTETVILCILNENSSKHLETLEEKRAYPIYNVFSDAINAAYP
ncbi:hypothetical protein HN924_01220 [Candidatus Woesearchaeota archaeon]|jgi:hypothetical protein|nr:hypothetical protein [Candidatus Woesearchaeota archaeon]MBT7062569.1 hypothetical protein [Candidatus Woesearchaeota archaeon]MBT7402362.1 hypothetical protein [Candidatus Woesearchaeota archaeon]